VKGEKGDEVLVLACDGVWDVMTNEEAIYFVSDVVLNSSESMGVGESENEDLVGRLEVVGKRLKGTNGEAVIGSTVPTALEAAKELIDLSFANGSTDNISAIVVKFLD
jgi:serine/threonine protein phosphatase PrpC